MSILQLIYRLPDRAAAENLQYPLGWEVALRQPLGLESCDPYLGGGGGRGSRGDGNGMSDWRFDLTKLD